VNPNKFGFHIIIIIIIINIIYCMDVSSSIESEDITRNIQKTGLLS